MALNIEVRFSQIRPALGGNSVGELPYRGHRETFPRTTGLASTAFLMSLRSAVGQE